MFIPTLETLLTKILNPQVPPFVNPRPLASASFKICRNHLNTSHKSPKSCHDFDQSCHDCSDPTVLTSPYQVNLVWKLLNRVTISQIVSRFFISKTSSLPSQIVPRWPNRDKIYGLPAFTNLKPVFNNLHSPNPF